MTELTVLTHALVNWCTSGACRIGSDWAGFTACHLFILLVGSIRASFAWTNTIVNRVATGPTDTCKKGNRIKIILVEQRINRTHDLRIRSTVTLPTELRDRTQTFDCYVLFFNVSDGCEWIRNDRSSSHIMMIMLRLMMMMMMLMTNATTASLIFFITESYFVVVLILLKLKCKDNWQPELTWYS